MLKCFYNLTILLIAFQCSFSQTGSLDSSFSGNGILPAPYDVVSTVQPDGKVIGLGAYWDAALSGYTNKIRRLKINGVPDSSFGKNGFVLADPNIVFGPFTLLKVCPDSKIIILANFDNDPYTMFRFLPDGNLDTSLNHTGKIPLSFDHDHHRFNDIVIQQDGRILLAGSISDNDITNPDGKFLIARLKKDGSIDNSFGTSGIITTIFNHHHENTALDSMNQTLYNFGASISAIALTNNKTIVAVGGQGRSYYEQSDDSIAIARYNMDGSLDSSLSEDGKLTIIQDTGNRYAAHATSVAIAPDGKILVAGSAFYLPGHGLYFYSKLELLRLDAGGALDNSFDNNGMKIMELAPYSRFIKMSLQSDGNILVGSTTGTGRDSEASSSVFFARINNNGSYDNSFGQNGILLPVFSDSSQGAQDRFNMLEITQNRIYINRSSYYSSQAIYAYKYDGINFNPQTRSFCSNVSSADISSDLQGTNYQWQLSTDSVHFNNISNDGYHSGVNTRVLSLNNIPASWQNYQYRCMADNSNSNVTTIHFLNANENEWTGTLSNAWENPANWLCGEVPANNADVIISNGNVVIQSNIIINSLHIQPGASVKVNTGFTLNIINNNLGR
ncbi:MAG: hypothetical protein ABI760_24355 [Ferruginibacter sp.]